MPSQLLILPEKIISMVPLGAIKIPKQVETGQKKQKPTKAEKSFWL
jgi:hypothetical protein